MADESTTNFSDAQYYKNYFQEIYKINLSDIEINDVINKNEPEFVFPELVCLAEKKKQSLINDENEKKYSINISTDQELNNNNNNQNLQVNNNGKNKKTISLAINFHGFNVNTATMYSRRILYDVDENRNYKILFNVGRGSHSDGKEKIRPEIEQVIRCINEKTNININQESNRNPGIIALSIDKSNKK